MTKFTTVPDPLNDDSLEGLLEIFGSTRSDDLFRVARHGLDLAQRDRTFPGCAPANRRRLAIALLITATLFTHQNER